jgi:drug/metabolite transporter (DMT)-like permease
MIIMVLGELSNFAAYSYAPAVLVTPLGALSVLISSVLASLFLGERLGRDGILGCALSIIGSVIIVLNSPEETKITSIDEMLDYALRPGEYTTLLSLLLMIIYCRVFGLLDCRLHRLCRSNFPLLSTNGQDKSVDLHLDLLAYRFHHGNRM